MAQAFYTGGYKSPVRQNLLEDWNKALKRLHGWLYLVLKQAAKDLDLRFKAQCLSAASREPWKTDIFLILQSLCSWRYNQLQLWSLGCSGSSSSWVSSCSWWKKMIPLNILSTLSWVPPAPGLSQDSEQGLLVLYSTQEHKVKSLEGNRATRPFFLMH